MFYLGCTLQGDSVDECLRAHPMLVMPNAVIARSIPNSTDRDCVAFSLSLSTKAKMPKICL